MKPIKLVMQGFGSYRENTVIDFASLDRGLYLITGPTGAGKTTIFDAIAFVLYGAPSGSDRTGAGLRNKNLEDNEECFVELEFVYADKTFKVRRSPSYSKVARTGNVRSINATAELTLPDGDVITQVTRVDSYIVNEIMHLDRNQFSQISMLAQGEFQKMLLASTKDKMPIFRQIFKTSLYDTLTERIKNDRRQLEEERNTLNTKIDVECKRIPDVEMGEEIEEKLSSIRERHLSIADSLEVLKEVLSMLDADYNHMGKSFEELSSKEMYLTGAIKNLHDYNQVKGVIAQLEAELPEVTKESEIATLALKDAEVKNGEYKESCIQKETENNRKLQDIADLGKLYMQLKNDEAVLRSRKQGFTEIENRRNDLDAELKGVHLQYEAFEDRTDEMIALNARIKELQIEDGKCQDVEGEVRKLNAHRIDQQRAQERYNDAFRNYEAAKNSYDEAYAIFYGQQAGILASTLEEGKPCPVCGSMHHPTPAVLADSDITDQELKRREADRNRKNDLVVSASGDAKVCSERIAHDEEILGDSLRELGIEYDGTFEANLGSKRDCIKNEMTSLNDDIRAISNEAQMKRKLEGVIDDLDEKIKRNNVEFDRIKSEISTLEGSFNARKESYRESADKLGSVDENALRNETRMLHREILEITSLYQKASAEKNYADGKLLRCTTTLENNRKRLESIKVEETDEEKLMQALDDVKTRKATASDEKTKIYSHMTVVDGIIRNLGKNQKEFDAVDMEFGNVDMLYTTFTGRLAGSKKVSLETYVQMAYFDRILGRANNRLLAMTSGRYEMKRERLDEIEKNNSAKGLDVLIVDHYEGCDRAVQTLSGGEKFLASLCLALGLSEEIESEAGGVHLDSIFIDEGFGSLDSESISLAMKALGDLAEGEKLVGIISHVDALQERIDKKIKVTRNMKGESKAEIII